MKRKIYKKEKKKEKQREVYMVDWLSEQQSK